MSRTAKQARYWYNIENTDKSEIINAYIELQQLCAKPLRKHIQVYGTHSSGNLQPEGHRPIILQADLHIRAELAGLDLPQPTSTLCSDILKQVLRLGR